MEKINHVISSTVNGGNRSYTPEEVQRAKEMVRRKSLEQSGLCNPDCPECAGLGYVSDNGRLVHCSRLDIWKLSGAKMLGITRDEYDSLSWTSIVPGNHSTISAIKAVKSVVNSGYGWVYLYGPFGTGKTLILKVAAVEAMHRGAGMGAAYTRMAEILDNLREGFDEKTGESETHRLNFWSEVKLLCIDEFEKMRGTPYTDERRFVLMDRRYEQATRMETATIIASNVAPNMLPGYLADRIEDGRFHVISTEGLSWRPGMTW